MGARSRFVPQDVVRLPLSGGDWIDVKKELNAGEARRVFTKLVKTMHAGEKTELDPEQVGKTKLAEYIVGWSLVDDQDRSVPFSTAALDNLDQDTYTEIMKAVDAHDEAVEKAREERKNDRGTSMVSAAT